VKTRRRVVLLRILALCAWILVGACERTDPASFIAEVDEQNFRRGKELLRQGRNQEALAEFQKLLEKRGLNNAPESHLELGLLYQGHIRDPIAAIYHFRKFRELKPNSPQSELVRQRIDAATREFAGTLPGDPLSNSSRFDNMTDVVQRLQRENEQLKSELARARAAVVARNDRPDSAVLDNENAVETKGPAYVTSNSPIAAPDADSNVESAPALPPPQRIQVPAPATQTPAPTPQVQPQTRTNPNQPPAPNVGGRRHVVGKGDTLYSLAVKYYSNKSRWRDIYQANRDQLKTPEDPLRIGMDLKIPQ
jgi:tetratricopeptide (TPR) repeat protein